MPDVELPQPFPRPGAFGIDLQQALVTLDRFLGFAFKLVNQREIDVDSMSFAAALKHVLRQDPDVILIGEMRDVESASVALTAAETGHLVFATLHTQDAPESIERLVNLGDRVRPGKLVARLEPQNEQNAVRTAEANLASAEGQLTHARVTFDRQRTLVNKGIAARAELDRAQELFQTAQAQVDAARAQVKFAKDQLGFTDLKADGEGIVTAIGAEPGEVVAAGRMIVQLFQLPRCVALSGIRGREFHQQPLLNICL